MDNVRRVCIKNQQLSTAKVNSYQKSQETDCVLPLGSYCSQGQDAPHLEQLTVSLLNEKWKENNEENHTQEKALNFKYH